MTYYSPRHPKVQENQFQQILIGTVFLPDWWPEMPPKPQKLQRKILVEVAKHPSGMQEVDLRGRLRYIFQTDDIPVDSALLGMDEDGIVFFQTDGSVSLTSLGYKLKRSAAKSSKS